MAFPPVSVSLCILSFVVLANVPNCVIGTGTGTGDGVVESRVPTVHEILQQYCFPKGLLPSSVKAYSFSSDGSFEVELEGNGCYVHFEKKLVQYGTRITGKLKHGSVSGVSGVYSKKLFVWLPVTGIKATDTSGMLEFFVGALSEKHPAKQFEEIHNCEKQISADLLIQSGVGSV